MRKWLIVLMAGGGKRGARNHIVTESWDGCI